MSLPVAELETLFTANVDQVEKAEKLVKTTGKRIESKPITAHVDADEKDALAGMDRVEAQAKRIVSEKTIATVDANIERAEKSFMRVYERLEYLQSVRTELDVEADIKRAEASLSKIERNLDGLRAARATMTVDADTAPAEAAFDDVQDEAGQAGEDAGEEFGDSVIAALLTIPIAGAVIGIGVAAGKALISGMQKGLSQEQGRDRLAALTGITEAEARRIALAAGEAYANVFGESIEANMDTARLALQFNLIDEASATKDAQSVIQNLAGIADVLEEDVRPVAAAVATMLRTGIAKNSKEAFDVLAAGARNGVNRAEDLLDTFTEYPALFRRLGLSGEEALGLINQGLDAGARNSDLAADALKEFQIRATDASEASAEGFELLGLNAEQMTAKIASGGEAARDGLALVLDKLRETEDPVLRNAAAVALFGTQAEDLGEALFAMDLSNAVDQLDGVEGAAQRMWDTLASNDATKIEQAQRNIEVAIEGINGALATAFSEPLGDFADWVSENRGPLLQFFSDLVNGAIDFGQMIVEAAAAGTESMGSFITNVLAPLMGALAQAAAAFDLLTPGDQSGVAFGLAEAADEMARFGDNSKLAADYLRNDVGGALEDARGRFNVFADAQIQMGYLNDASLRLAGAIDQVGSDTGSMESQVRAAIAALGDQISAAEAAGEGQQQLSERYLAGRDALVEQMVQMGLTEAEAQALIDTVMKTPTDKKTEYSSNANTEKGKVQALADRIETLPDGSVRVTADTQPARNAISRLIRDASGATIGVRVGSWIGSAKGNLLEFMGAGGLTPMAPVAQMVPPNTWRVVGDRGDVPEVYAPLDGSARSWALLMEALRRMPGRPQFMADGGLVGRGRMPSSTPTGPLDLSDATISALANVLAAIVRLDQRRGGETLG